MYVILNAVTNEIHKFSKVRYACAYLKFLKHDKSSVTKEEIRELCNIFAKYKNKIAINGLRNSN